MVEFLLLSSSLVGGKAALSLALPGPDAGADLLVEVEPLGAHLHRAHAVQARVELVALARLGRRVDAVLPRAERVPRLGPLQRVTPPALVLRVLEGGGERARRDGVRACVDFTDLRSVAVHHRDIHISMLYWASQQLVG